MPEKANAVSWGALALAAGLLAASATCTAIKITQRPHSANDRGNRESPNASGASRSTPRGAEHTEIGFLGEWINEDSNGSTTKLAINRRGTDLQVHAWALCSPEECDWGVESASVTGEAANVTWNQRFVSRRMTITLHGSDQLLIVTENEYKDGRPGKVVQESFRRPSSTPSNQRE
jgi:hypothetical protein